MVRFDKTVYFSFLLQSILSLRLMFSDVLLFFEIINIVLIFYYNFIEIIILLYTF